VTLTIDIGNENSAFTSDRYQTSAEVDKAATVAQEVQRKSSALLLKTVHHGPVLYDSACESKSIVLVDVSGGPEVTATLSKISAEAMYDRPYVAFVTGRLARLGNAERLDTTEIQMVEGRP
jgi:hypothetical protein